MVLRLDELVHWGAVWLGGQKSDWWAEQKDVAHLTVWSQNSHHSLPHMPAAVFKGAHLKINFLDSILMILPEVPAADPDGIIILSLKCRCSQFETTLELSGEFAKICGAAKFNSNQETIVLAKYDIVSLFKSKNNKCTNNNYG